MRSLLRRLLRGILRVPPDITLSFWWMNWYGKRILRINPSCPWPVHITSTIHHPDKVKFGKNFIGYAEERKGIELKAQTQEALLALGYDIGDIDGVIGRNTRAAIKKFQNSQGLAADGKESPQLLERMKSVAQQKGLRRPEISAAEN